MKTCAVRGCIAPATTAIEDFVCCEAHCTPETRAILERLEAPGKFYYKDKPIVLPCGELLESDFE